MTVLSELSETPGKPSSRTSRVLRQVLRKWIPSTFGNADDLESFNASSAGSRLAIQVKDRDTSSSTWQAVEERTQEIVSVFPSCDCHSAKRKHIMRWYPGWILQQVRGLPPSVIPLVAEAGIQDDLSHEFRRMFLEVADLITADHCQSIDTVVDALVAAESNLKSTANEQCEIRSLVFAILGWQTMLFRPGLGTCESQHQLAVTDEQDGYRGQAFMTLKQSTANTKRAFHDFLMGFGVILPPPNFCSAVKEEDKIAFDEVKTVEPVNFNASLFSSIGHFHIAWIDSISCHLEFDERTKTVFLFKYPSFCLSCLPSQNSEKELNSVIHHAASSVDCSGSWANKQDVTSMLRETLLSYRILFGQSKTSRKYFRKVDPFVKALDDDKDEILSKLCGRKAHKLVGFGQDKTSYDLRQDFPILRSRLTRLHGALSATKPRGWKELWNDKRDSAAWLTFWAVIVFGGLGVFLAFMQVVLQSIQLAINR